MLLPLSLRTAEFVPWRGCSVFSTFHSVSTAFFRTRKPLPEDYAAYRKVAQVGKVP